MRSCIGRGIAAAAALLAFAGQGRADAPRVVASIPPVHSLVAMAMDGVGTPHLLLQGGASPHSYAMRPSDSRALAEAALIVRIGPGLETFLDKPLGNLRDRTAILEIASLPDLKKLPVREGGLLDDHGDGDHDDGRDREEDHHREEGHRYSHDHGDDDPHLWLDTGNAAKIVAAVAERLAGIDPANATSYRANATRWGRRLAAQKHRLAARLAPVRKVPFVVLHDAWQYFEAEFGLRAVGVVAVSPEHPPGARRLLDLRIRIRAVKAKCVFSEPQFPAKVAKTVARGLPVRSGTLDPLGVALTPGPDLYPALMDNLVHDLVACLEDRL